MKKWFLSLLLCVGVHGYIYNDSLLLIYAKVVPRIMLLDHTKSGEVTGEKLCILYEGRDRAVAQKFKEMALKNLPASVISSFEIVTVSYEDSQKCAKATALMLLDTKPINVKRVLKSAKERRVLTFSYSNELLKDGVTVSLSIGKAIYPIVNIEAVKSSSLRLDPALFQTAKIYEGGKIR